MLAFREVVVFMRSVLNESEPAACPILQDQMQEPGRKAAADEDGECIEAERKSGKQPDEQGMNQIDTE